MIIYIDPHIVFTTEPPFLPIVDSSAYWDKTEIGMSNYLQILPSIGLYGFQFAVPIDKSFKIIDGNFRTLAARELGITLPVTFKESKQHYNSWRRVLRRIDVLKRIGLLLKRNSLLFKKIKTDKNVNITTHYFPCQYNIFINEQLSLRSD